MTILALEFSSEQRSVAVARGEKVLGEVVETGGRNVNAFGMIEQALAAAKIGREEIEAIVAGLGPGSYTGIRSAIALAQGWQLARAIKLLGISSVEAIVAQARSEKILGRVNAVIDAQRNEFYLAAHELSENGGKEIEPLRILTLAEVQARAAAKEILIGPEITRWFPAGRLIFPRAAALAILAANCGNFMAGERLEPIYLRETNFVKTPPRKPARA